MSDEIKLGITVFITIQKYATRPMNGGGYFYHSRFMKKITLYLDTLPSIKTFYLGYDIEAKNELRYNMATEAYELRGVKNLMHDDQIKKLSDQLLQDGWTDVTKR